MISVVIPTRNRAPVLKDALESVLCQTLAAPEYEVMVVDNGSTDSTRAVVEAAAAEKGAAVRYLCAPEPGLHVGRHAGAMSAQGDLLVFADDDIIATPGWLASVRDAFSTGEDVGLVGGKVLPRWGADPPEWLDLFKTVNEHGWAIGYLSLLDFGDERKEVPPGFVFGCNYSIRKSVLMECGGFHPDGMPAELIKYRGDGETALSLKVRARGYRTLYEPGAAVYHRVPAERLTAEYFCQRAFNQGVSDSFTEIRKDGGLKPAVRRGRRKGAIGKVLGLLSGREHPVRRQVRETYLEGREFHRRCVESDPELLKYVLREDYL